MANLNLGNGIPGEESENGIRVATSYFDDFKICRPPIYLAIQENLRVIFGDNHRTYIISN